MYLDRVIAGQLAKAVPLQAESLQQEENRFAVDSPPADLGAHYGGARLFRWLSVLLVFICQGAMGEIFPYISPFYKISLERNT